MVDLQEDFAGSSRTEINTAQAGIPAIMKYDPGVRQTNFCLMPGFVLYYKLDKSNFVMLENSMVYETNGEKETRELGFRLAREAKPGDVYTLTGDLGVGKTVFTKGFAEGLGITEPVSSPTFTIVQQYDSGRLPFYHFDVYRIGDVEEMDEIGYEDCFYGEGVTMIEWAKLIREILPTHRTKILIEKDLERGFDYRRITIEEVGE